MAWIELHQSLVSHIKIIRLRRLLRIRTPQAIGHICMLWLWSLDNAPNGDISTLDPHELAEICDYRGKNPQVFFSALIEAGFLNPDKSIHDWFDYTGKLITFRENKRKRDRDYQMKKSKKAVDSPASRIPTKPNQTKQYQTQHTDFERVDLLFTSMIHKTDENEQIRLNALLEQFDTYEIENAIKTSAGKAKSLKYIERILENQPKKNKNSTFELSELDKLINRDFKGGV